MESKLAGIYGFDLKALSKPDNLEGGVKSPERLSQGSCLLWFMPFRDQPRLDYSVA